MTALVGSLPAAAHAMVRDFSDDAAAEAEKAGCAVTRLKPVGKEDGLFLFSVTCDADSEIHAGTAACNNHGCEFRPETRSSSVE
ncbi:MAG: hypothetical protein QF926_12530 [Alphaproteobacteria bacterium]|jgi:hypothetical protein|nr:hypothetical protein [Alphaproteobacteria bacterium]